MLWIKVAANAPYFCTEDGMPWTPIGHNSAIPWPDLHSLFKRKDFLYVENYFQTLQNNGITCIRIMMEYCQNNNYYLEKPLGVFQPNIVAFFDDLFVLCRQYGIRLLITPFDTYWMWRRWRYHPYNKQNGGNCKRKTQWLCCPDMLESILKRVDFIIQRWSGNGALFAWDLWNEIHPKYSANECDGLLQYITTVGHFIRDRELALYNKSHLQTVSAYGLNYTAYAEMPDILFQNQTLDFATTHLYAKGSIDSPKNTVDAAIVVSELISKAIEAMPAGRPFMDSEHGPIYRFVNRKRMLKEPFDDEYFKHIQWAHLASGGAGGGLRWPYRRPHVLTPGMRAHQQKLALFAKMVSWNNLNRTITKNNISLPLYLHAFCCGSNTHAVVWILRTQSFDKLGMLSKKIKPEGLEVLLSGLVEGFYAITIYNTSSGQFEVIIKEKIALNDLSIIVNSFVKDVALYICPLEPYKGSQAPVIGALMEKN